MADRRNWTSEEEDALINILEGIVANGGRGDNGSFRSGTYDLVANKLREKIANITITAKHVQNKMKRLKDKYSAAYDMLNTSGFGWDDTRKCVVIDDTQILAEYLKKHPNKNYTPNKPFPHYERLCIVFGKDRATGNMAESATDAFQHMGLENEDLETPFDAEALPTPSNVASGSSSHTSSLKRKRDVGTSSTKMTTMLERSMDKASADITRLTDAITGGDVMARISVELEELGLNEMEVIEASIYFGQNPNQLRIFNGMKESLKVNFVKRILEKYV